MGIDDVIQSQARFCKETGKPLVDGKCACPGESQRKECRCQGNIDLTPLIPFLIHNSMFYKGPSL